tara:strand:- start:1043 stop:2242 length:1200 start_codon:yes stop_codon:yes gene_type:complete
MVKFNTDFDKYFSFYLIFILGSSIFLINSNYLLDTNNSIAEWVINYQGGFGRRGLIGELFLLVSSITGIYLKNVILYFLIIIFTFYYLLIYYYFRNLNLNKIFIIAIYSPLFLMFPIAELEGLGRKDILIPFSFLVFAYFYNKLDFKNMAILLLFIYTPLILIHEVSIFYLPFFYFIIFLKLEKFNFLDIFLIVIVTIILLSTIYILSNSIHTDNEIFKMCQKLMILYNTKCGLGAYVLNRTLQENISELGGLKIIDIFRGLWIYLLGSVVLIFCVVNSKYEKNKVNFLFKKINFNFTFFVILFPTLVPFLIAVDWGRWFNLSYTMLILFYFFCFKNNLIMFNQNHYVSLFNKILNKKYIFITFILIVCFSWNPKAVYSEDIGSIPVYRVIEKIFSRIN